MRPQIAGALGAVLAFTQEAHALELEEPKPPPPAPYVESSESSADDYVDWRLAVAYGAGTYSTGDGAHGSVRDAWSLHLDHTWSSGLPAPVWSVGLEFGLAHTDLSAANSTMYLFGVHFGAGYGFPINDNLQVELVPYVEIVASGLDTGSTGGGVGGGVRTTLAYTFDSGFQFSAIGGYSLRWLHLSRDCSGLSNCEGFSADVTAQVPWAALAIAARW